MHARESSYGGFRVLELTTSALSLRCAPELGGRVFSLVDRAAEREWLWRQPSDAFLFRASDPRDFGTGTFAGLDECVPSVQSCAWIDGRPIADHGEFWSMPWSVEEFAPGRLSLLATAPAFGLAFRRTITVSGATVRFDYALSNVSTQNQPALWSMHPLFTLMPEDRLELPAYVRRLIVESARPELPCRSSTDATISFPEIAPGVFLDRLELADCSAGWLKAFAEVSSVEVGEAGIRNARTGNALRVRWDGRAAPYLGIWLTRGGFRGWHHVALEPTNAPCDSVKRAHNGSSPESVLLAAGATRTWWVEWTVDRPA